ncbi:MAG: hypothetical protein JXB14_03660 [Candidatus Altiarchaeota archaeon]|nr:hypothetical protein [Candidatus Altiarchaeota archaeon]
MKRDLEHIVLITTLTAVIAIGLIMQIIGVSERGAQKTTAEGGEPEAGVQETGDRFIIKDVGELPLEPSEPRPLDYPKPTQEGREATCQDGRIVLMEDVDWGLFIDCKVVLGRDDLRISNSEFIRSPLLINETSGGIFVNNVHRG